MSPCLFLLPSVRLSSPHSSFNVHPGLSSRQKHPLQIVRPTSRHLNNSPPVLLCQTLVLCLDFKDLGHQLPHGFPRPLCQSCFLVTSSALFRFDSSLSHEQVRPIPFFAPQLPIWNNHPPLSSPVQSLQGPAGQGCLPRPLPCSGSPLFQTPFHFSSHVESRKHPCVCVYSWICMNVCSPVLKC